MKLQKATAIILAIAGVIFLGFAVKVSFGESYSATAKTLINIFLLLGIGMLMRMLRQVSYIKEQVNIVSNYMAVVIVMRICQILKG